MAEGDWLSNTDKTGWVPISAVLCVYIDENDDLHYRIRADIGYGPDDFLCLWVGAEDDDLEEAKRMLQELMDKITRGRKT